MGEGVTYKQLFTVKVNLTNWPKPEYLLTKMFVSKTKTENRFRFAAAATRSPVTYYCCIRILSIIWKWHKWLTISAVKSLNSREVALSILPITLIVNRFHCLVMAAVLQKHIHFTSTLGLSILTFTVFTFLWCSH